MPTPEVSIVDPAATRRQRVLLGEQTLGSLLRNIVHVYRRHFGVIVGCVVLPILPFMLLMAEFGESSPLTAVVATIGYLGALLVCPAAFTVVLSDICVGNTPRLSRAFGHILGGGRWWHLFTTGMLLALGMMLGLVLLILPGIWVFVRSLFGATIVMLEGRRNMDALRRSFALTQGQAWRLTWLTLAPILAAYLVAIPLILVVAIAAALAGEGSMLAQHIAVAGIYMVILGLVLPVASITAVLLYYDQRVRRESYDAQALSEDLMR